VRVAVHQPHYLPWLGLVDKIDRCDLFIHLDHVQYERRGWQNRNYIAAKGDPVMLTVPVVQRSRDELIQDKLVDNTQDWRTKHRRAIAEFCYPKAPYWSDFGSDIVEIYDREWQHLVDLAIASTDLILKLFDVRTPTVRSSRLGEFHGSKSELIAQIAAKAGATTLLSGDGARGYMDPELFAEYGVDIEWQDFRHPEYRQFCRGEGDFLPRMAAIDLLLNEGPAGIDLLRAARGEGG
jgi:hypothetical protein